MIDEALMKRFCKRGPEAQEVLKAPFVRDGLKVATNGRVAVFFETEETETPGAPNFKAIMEYAFRGADAWHPWTPRDDGKTMLVTCEACAGKGTGWKTCLSCRGVGRHSCGCCHHVERCYSCNGKGHVEDRNSSCGECQGTGKVVAPAHVELPTGDLVEHKEMKLLALLPGLEVASRKKLEEYPMRPIAIRFDGGRGIVMPAKPKEDDGGRVDRTDPAGAGAAAVRDGGERV